MLFSDNSKTAVMDKIVGKSAHWSIEICLMYETMKTIIGIWV